MSDIYLLSVFFFFFFFFFFCWFLVSMQFKIISFYLLPFLDRPVENEEKVSAYWVLGARKSVSFYT